MLILDKPYVSKFLEETILKLDLPVLKNETIEEFNLNSNLNLLAADEFVAEFKDDKVPLIYSNSENSINWIANNLNFTDLPKKIDLFKDKVQFRDLLAAIYPNFFYQEVKLSALEKLDIEEIDMPFIIKPAVGFFSMGVYKVNSIKEWESIVNTLKQEVNNFAAKYPKEVINTQKFIIEENIEGEEFALDLYYDQEGEPIILNILQHLFSSGEDVNDRVYITSKEIIKEYHDLFLDFLVKIGNLVDLKGFPMHIEFRMDKERNIIPIEVNPIRFAGWCTTDMAYYAYGINVYQYFFEQKKPNWEEILEDKRDQIYSIVVADLPNDINSDTIKQVDYDRFYSYFEKPLEMRKIDYNQHGVFAFLFAETSYGNKQELSGILKSDLKEYIYK